MLWAEDFEALAVGLTGGVVVITEHISLNT